MENIFNFLFVILNKNQNYEVIFDTFQLFINQFLILAFSQQF